MCGVLGSGDSSSISKSNFEESSFWSQVVEDLRVDFGEEVGLRMGLRRDFSISAAEVLIFLDNELTMRVVLEGKAAGWSIGDDGSDRKSACGCGECKFMPSRLSNSLSDIAALPLDSE